MNSQRALGGEALKGSFIRTDSRDLAKPELEREGALARLVAALRSVLLWALVFAIAASGALLVGSLMPELNAAVPNKATPIAAKTRPDKPVADVGDWYLPHLLFNDDAEPAEPIEAF